MSFLKYLVSSRSSFRLHKPIEAVNIHLKQNKQLKEFGELKIALDTDDNSTFKSYSEVNVDKQQFTAFLFTAIRRK